MYSVVTGSIPLSDQEIQVTLIFPLIENLVELLINDLYCIDFDHL